MDAAISAAVDPITSQLADVAKYGEPAALWRKTTTGNPVTCYPVPESPLYPKVSLVATQEGTGDPSPENIRPIVPSLATGQKLKVKRTGKNLIYPAFAGRAHNDIVWTVNADRSVTANGTAAGMSFLYSSRPYGTSGLIYIPGGTYVFSKNSLNVTASVVRYDSVDGVERLTVQLPTDKSSMSVVWPTGGWCYVNIWCASREVLSNENITVQLELGSTATPYEPYSGDSYEWTAPQDIYGLPGAEAWMANDGSEYDTTTLLTLTGNENWMKYGGSTIGYRMDRAFADNGCLEGISSHFKSITSPQLTSNVVGVYLRYTMELIVNYDRVADVTEFKAWLAAQVTAGTPVQILCKRATPTTASGSAVSILALPQLDRYTPRQNVLTVDKGALTVGYAKSPIRESDELQAAIAALS